MSDPRSSTPVLALAMQILSEDVDSSNGIPDAALREASARFAELHLLLTQCLPIVQAQHGAEHLLDGFKPKKRDIDGLLADIKRALQE